MQPERPYKGKQIKPWADSATDFLQAARLLSGGNGRVKTSPAGTTLAVERYVPEQYHFELIYDPSYTPTSTERRIAIRGGRWWRGGDAPVELTISASTEFGAAGGELDDYSSCLLTMSDQDEWIVYLTLVTTLALGRDPYPVKPTELRATLELGTIASPPSRSAIVDPSATSDNAQQYIKVLGRVRNQGGSLVFEQEWRGGNIKDSVIIPDGRPMYEDALPRIESLDFVRDDASNANNGELQDRNAHQILINGATVAQFDGDHVMVYFDYRQAGVTQKKYARLDASNADLWNKFSSTEIYSDKVQIYGFEQNAATSNVDLSTELNTWELMARRRDAGSGSTLVDYIDGSSMKVSDSAHSDVADVADYANDGPWPRHHDQTDPAASGSPDPGWPSEINANHDSRYQKHADGTGGIDSKNYDTTGYHRAGQFALTDQPVTNAWNSSAFLVNVDGPFSLFSTSLDKIDSDGNRLSIFGGSAGGVEIGSAVDINLLTDTKLTGGDYYHEGSQGITGDGFSGGLKTDETAFNAAIERQTQDLLAGWGLL